MNAVESIKALEEASNEYRKHHSRYPLKDLVIWQTLDMYYSDAEGYGLVLSSTKEEAFERMISDSWTAPYDFYGIDYETIDELVFDYLIKNGLVGVLEEIK